jgi:translin
MNYVQEVLENLRRYVEEAREALSAKNEVREKALADARELIKRCALSIRACHREEWENASSLLGEASEIASRLKALAGLYPDLYHSGYTQDSLKEFVEASLVRSLLLREAIPGPKELGVEPDTYLRGLGEAMGELRRHILDLIRKDEFARAEELLTVMEEVHALLMTMDFPDALTGGLRHTGDMVRGVVERTRSDFTAAYENYLLRKSLEKAKDEWLKRASDKGQ